MELGDNKNIIIFFTIVLYNNKNIILLSELENIVDVSQVKRLWLRRWSEIGIKGGLRKATDLEEISQECRWITNINSQKWTFKDCLHLKGVHTENNNSNKKKQDKRKTHREEAESQGGLKDKLT